MRTSFSETIHRNHGNNRSNRPDVWCSGRDLDPGPRLERPLYLTGLYYRSAGIYYSRMGYIFVPSLKFPVFDVGLASIVTDSFICRWQVRHEVVCRGRRLSEELIMALDSSTAVRTVVPILILVGFGYLSRKIGVLKSGDERVLNAYVYYFALPALFLADLSETKFTSESLSLVLTGIIPILVVVSVYSLFHLAFKFPKDVLYLLIFTTIFGSLAFFGIPFIVFAFPEAESLATLSAASISIVSVPISIAVLEFYRIEGLGLLQRLKHLGKRLSRNPLVLSILIGSLMSIADVGFPTPLADSLHMLGITTAPVAIFLLGVFLYGRTYTNVRRAFQLSLLRIIFLPVLALIFTSVLNLQGLEKTVVVLMHATPIAISTIVLSERYDFYKETIASLLLISSVGAAIYLNLWLLALGQLS